MKGQEGRRPNNKINARELLWQAREATAAGVRNPKSFAGRIFNNTERLGIKGDSKFVVLSAALLIENGRLRQERDAAFKRFNELTRKENTIWHITTTFRLKASSVLTRLSSIPTAVKRLLTSR